MGFGGHPYVWGCPNLRSMQGCAQLTELGFRPWVSWQAFEKGPQGPSSSLCRRRSMQEDIDPESGANRECEHIYLPLPRIEE